VGVQVETWKDNHPQQFFWNGPDGSISQIIDSAKYKVGHAGDIYTLTATLGGNGKGTLHEITSLLIEGKPAISAPSNLVDPQGPILPVSVTYTAKKSDVGKSIGVRFAWQKPQTDMQAQVDDVSMTVTSKH